MDVIGFPENDHKSFIELYLQRFSKSFVKNVKRGSRVPPFAQGEGLAYSLSRDQLSARPAAADSGEGVLTPHKFQPLDIIGVLVSLFMLTR